MFKNYRGPQVSVGNRRVSSLTGSKMVCSFSTTSLSKTNMAANCRPYLYLFNQTLNYYSTRGQIDVKKKYFT